MKKLIPVFLLFLIVLPCYANELARMNLSVIGISIPTVSGCTTTADYATDTTADYPSVGMTSGYEIVSTAISVTNTYDICKLSIKLKKVGSPTFNIKVRIYNAGADKPGTQNGQDSDVIASSTFTTSEVAYTFTFSGTKPSVSSGTYWIGIVAVSPPNDWSNYVQFSVSGLDLNPLATASQMSSADGSSWTGYSDRYSIFTLYR